MPKKQKSNRLDKLFDNINGEEAVPTKAASDKNTARPGEKKPSTKPAKSGIKPSVRSSALAQTNALPALEALTMAQPGTETTPATMSLAFQLDDRSWATLQVADDRALRAWDQNEQLLVKQVTDQLSQALENARLFQETRSRAEELAILNEMGRELSALFNAEEIAATVYKFASRLMDTTNLFVSLYDEAQQEITPIYVINDRERVQVPPRKLGNGLTDYILRTREPLLIPEDIPGRMKKIGLEVIFLGNNRPALSWLGVPMLVGKTAIGVIGVQSVETANLYTERHRDILTAIAERTAIAIENARLFRESQARAEELAVLNELAQRLSARLDVDQMLQEIYKGVARLIDAKNFYIGLYAPEKNEVTFPLNVSESVIDRQIVTIRADQGLTGYVLRTRAPLLIPENVSEKMAELGIGVVGEPAKSWLGMPLLLGDQVIGVMAVQSYTQSNAYNEHDRDLLLAFAGQAAISLQNARLFTETERRSYEISTLAEIANEIAASHKLQPILTRIAEHAKEFLSVDEVAIYMLNQDDQTLRPRAAVGKYSQEILADVAHLGQGITGSIAQKGLAEIINDPYNDPRSRTISGTPKEDPGTETIMVAPIESRGEIIGTINVWRTRELGLFTERDLNFLVNLARQAAIAIENTRLFEETQHHTEETILINRIITSVTRSLDISENLQLIADEIAKLVSALHVGIALVDKSKNSLVLTADAPVDPHIESPLGLKIPIAGNPTAEPLLQTRKPIFINNTDVNPLAAQIKDVLKLRGTQSLFVWPIIAGDEVIGSLGIDFAEPDRALDSGTLQLIETILIQASTAIQNGRLFQDSQQRAEEMATLNDLGQALASQLNLSQVLDEVYKGVSRLLDTSNFYIAIYDEPSREIIFPYNVSESQVDREITRLPIDQGITGYIVRNQESLLIHGNSDEWFANHGIEFIGEPFQCFLGVPLLISKQALGAVAVQSQTNPDAFSEHDRYLLSAIANQAAISIQNARLFESVQRRVTELSMFNDISRELASEMRPEELYRLVHQQMSRLFDTNSFFIGTYETGSDHWQMAYQIENGKPSELLGPRDLKAGLSSHMIKTRQPLLFHSTRELDDFHRSLGLQQLGLAGSKSWMGVPLIATGQMVGVMVIQNYQQENLFSDQDQALFLTIAQQVATALQNARLFQDVQRRAEIERLTGEISTNFVSINPAETDKGIYEALQALGEFTHVDRAYLFRFRQDGQVMDNTNEWCAPGISSHIADLQNLPASTYPYVLKSLKRLGAFRISRLSDLPEEAAAEKESFQRESIQSITCVPLIQRDALIGFVGLDAVKEEHVWEDDELNLLRIVGDIFVTALNRKETAQALEKSEADLRALFSSMQDIVLVIDKDTRYVRIAPTNPSRLYRPSEELLGQRMDEILPAETHEPFRKAIRQALDTNEAVQIEYSLPVGGQEFWFLANITKLNDEQVFWVARDITGRKKAEEDIQKFKLGIDQSTDAVFITDINGTITYANPGFEKVYGYPPAEALGKTPRIIKSGLMTQENYQQFWGGLLNKQTLSGEIINKSKDGRFISIDGTNSPILDENGNILGFLAVHHDITDRKQAEEELKRRNEYLSATAEIGRLVTSTFDMSTLFSRTVNLVRDRFGFYHAGIFVTEETGFNAVLQEATGEAGAEMKRQQHGLQVGSKSVVGEATETGQPVIVSDTTQSEIHKPNPLLPETRAEAAIPLRVGSRTIGALDIQSTQPNAFSESDIAVLQTLADQVAIAIDNARSYELSMQAVKEMREADRLKSQFLANMSHELRTPLNSIIGFSRVILKGIDGAITDLQQQDLLAIHNSGQHLLGLINDILDLSRIEAGKMELTFDEVNLPELVASVMSTVTGLVRDKNIQLVRDLPADLPTVRADAMRVRQVLLNLLSNAAKFTDEGKITVTAVVTDKPAGHSEIMVRVTDTGPGISPDDQKKLFQPFSQVDASPTRKTGGSGLGLSISNHLIQMHGGRMGVESGAGQGSTFFFTLPAFRVKNTSNGENPGNRTILAIDDDPQVINLYERYLSPQGYQLISLSDPSRAVERARTLKPFAITLDIMMPGYDGWRVLNDLKSNAETRDIPVIVCSIVEDQEKGFSLGAADYLLKPILENDILEALDRLNPDGSIREVLVIDDDPNDLRLISKMLSENGRYHPSVAEGGTNGWDAIQSRPPHAVILDLFMPDLDGFSILEKMRTTEKLRDVPVIVVSGGDLTSEQQKQLQEFGQRMIQKSALTEKQLLDTLEHALKRVSN